MSRVPAQRARRGEKTEASTLGGNALACRMGLETLARIRSASGSCSADCSAGSRWRKPATRGSPGITSGWRTCAGGRRAARSPCTACCARASWGRCANTTGAPARCVGRDCRAFVGARRRARLESRQRLACRCGAALRSLQV